MLIADDSVGMSPVTTHTNRQAGQCLVLTPELPGKLMHAGRDTGRNVKVRPDPVPGRLPGRLYGAGLVSYNPAPP